jgi:flagellar protein FliS
MWQNAHDAYVDSRVLAADPVDLVKLLYQAAIASVRDARCHLEKRDIAARARAISKAGRILTELTVSLDHERGGEVSRGLARLYDYMSRRLIEANFRQADQPLEEVLGLLLTLLDGWEGIQPAAQPEPRADSIPVQPLPQADNPWAQPELASDSPWAQSLPQAPLSESAPAYGSHAWSF